MISYGLYYDPLFDVLLQMFNRSYAKIDFVFPHSNRLFKFSVYNF